MRPILYSPSFHLLQHSIANSQFGKPPSSPRLAESNDTQATLKTQNSQQPSTRSPVFPIQSTDKRRRLLYTQHRHFLNTNLPYFLSSIVTLNLVPKVYKMRRPHHCRRPQTWSVLRSHPLTTSPSLRTSTGTAAKTQALCIKEAYKKTVCQFQSVRKDYYHAEEYGEPYG